MPTHLKRKSPVAKKTHICNYCGCKIEPGTAYWRDTLVYDGTVYDWITHKECMTASNKLCMYDDCDDNGLGPDYFSESIDSYVDCYFLDEKTDDLPEEVRSLDLLGRVKLILATWDRPDIALQRKKVYLNELKMMASYSRDKEKLKKRIADLETEISELEKEIVL